MTRRRVAMLAALLAVLLAVAAAASRRAFAPAQPNVVLVVVDALRRDHVGAYGHAVPTTPFVDELARRGVVFEDAWSQAPQTFNATAAVLTARVFPLLRDRAAATPQPASAMMLRGLADENDTLAELLGAAGYDTLAIFTNPHHDEGSGFAQGFRLWRYLAPERPEHVYARSDAVEHTFRELAARLDPERPFFAYVHYMDVHNPYLPPPELAVQFVRTAGVDRYRNGRPEGDEVPSSDDLHFMMESYDACIRRVDDSLRTLSGVVADVARGRDTIFIVMADHGDEFMDHGGLGHGHTMYPELLRVPLIVNGDGIPNGVRVHGLARGIDVGATITDLARSTPTESFDGRSLLPMVRAAAAGLVRPASPDVRAVRVRLQGDEDAFSFAWNADLRSVTTDDLHFLADTQLGTFELYDAREDPNAQDDLAGTAGRTFRRLRRKMEEYEQRLNEVERRSAELSRGGHAPAVGERAAAQLKALGYVE